MSLGPQEPMIRCYKEDLVTRLQAEMPPEDALLELSRFFGALSDPTRLRIIGALASGEELCVCDIANVVGISLSATSHQLRKLRDLGVVTYRADGRMAHYRLCNDLLPALIQQARVGLEQAAA